MTGRTGEKAKQEKRRQKERKKESIDLPLPCGYITCREASLSLDPCQLRSGSPYYILGSSQPALFDTLLHSTYAAGIILYLISHNDGQLSG